MFVPVTVPPIFPVMPEAKFHISEREPLIWLVSILFTQEFWQRDNLTRVPMDLYKFAEPDLGVKPKYESWPALYHAAENWVKSNEQAAACLTLAKTAIERGELSYYTPKADKWGDRPYYEPERDVESYQFLCWAEKNCTPIPKDVLDASQVAIHMAVTRKGQQDHQTYAYPAITSEDFARLRKEPLWEVNTGLLYLIGRRSRVKNKESGYTGDSGLFNELADYVVDAQRSKQLELIQETESTTMKVVPENLIKWAETLPVSLPMLNPTPASNEIPAPISRPAHCTPDMELMYDAIERFWSGYDLANPNPSVAPLKKEVMAWLLAEAKKRKITDFSESRAKNIDTIIRCPKARLGGNSL